MRFAGFAKAARRIFIGLPLLSGVVAWQPAAAQNSGAQEWYAKGLQALSEGRPAEARAALQEAVAADPSFAGAWLDLAIATHAAGDPVQAEEFLTILEDRFQLPEAIATGVANLRRRLQESSATSVAAGSWRWRRAFQAGAGHDSNANAGLARTDLTLTLPGGGLVLPIDPALRPQSDRYALASLGIEGARRQGPGQLELSGSIRARANTQVTDFDTRELQAGIGYAGDAPVPGKARLSWLPGPWRVGANVQQLHLGGRTLLNSLSLSALHAWAALPCSPQGAVEIDHRSFPVAPNLDSRLLWLSAAAVCPSSWLGSGGKLGATLRAGSETARHAFSSTGGRPGGNTRHLEATFTHQWSWAGPNGTHRLEAQAQWAWARDSEGYSPLLDNNARRTVRRAGAGVTYSIPLEPAGTDGSGWIANLLVQGFQQRSNLELFRVRGALGQVTFQKHW